MSDGRPVHVDFEKKISEGSQKKPTPALLPNRLEKEKINNNGETGVRNGKANSYITYVSLVG